jgi:hypothetical protein
MARPVGTLVGTSGPAANGRTATLRVGDPCVGESGTLTRAWPAQWGFEFASPARQAAIVTGEQMAMISADPVVMHSCDRRDARLDQRDLGLRRRADRGRAGPGITRMPT